MPFDKTISMNVAKNMNPLNYNRSLPTGDMIKCIIKNTLGEELVFKDHMENWTPYKAKRIKQCDIRSSLCEDLRYYFPTMDLRTKHFTLTGTTFDTFNNHIYEFELNIHLDKYILIQLPSNSQFKEFKWLEEEKPIIKLSQESAPIEEPKDTKKQNKKKLNIEEPKLTI